MKTFYRINTFLILALGIIHISVTPLFLRGVTESAMWFISGGLMMVFLSFFNFILMKITGGEHAVILLCRIANIAGLIFASAIFAVNSLRSVPPIQFWLVLFLFIFETIASFRYRSQ